MNIAIIILILLIVYVLFVYNVLISKRNRISQAASGIDVYLTQRFDLIPNLVECVKGYMKHEERVFQNIAQLREKYYHDRNLKEGEVLNNQFNEILAISENYPELKANEQFLNLQKKLEKMESQLQAARRIYNVEVNTYNNSVQMFPNNLVAKIFNFKLEEFFEAEEEVKNNVKVDYKEG